MLRIVTHIEQLLLMHDCIIIPKLGGFVLQNVPAGYRADEHAFRPMRKEVVFNTALQHNDGLLSESYMQMYGVDYRKAQLMWEEDVEELKSTLQQEKNVSLGIVGSFETGTEGQLVFHPGEAHTFSVESYGLPFFELPSLEMLEMEEREEVALLVGKKKPRETSRAVHWNFFRAAAATAAAIALFLVVSTPVREVNPSTYTASFVPTEMVAYNTQATANLSPSSASLPKADTPSETTPAKERKETAASHPVASPSSVEKESAAAKGKTIKTTSQKDASRLAQEGKKASLSSTHTPAVPRKSSSPEQKAGSSKSQPASLLASASSKSTAAKAENKKMYHIVIASFPSEAQANAYIAGIDRSECKHVSKVVRDGRYRIYADKFDNRKDAEAYMATLRKNQKYKDAWLFISR